MRIIHKFKVWCCEKKMNVMNYELENGVIIAGYKNLMKYREENRG